MLDERLLHDIIELVSVKGGLRVRSQDGEILSNAVLARTKLLKTSPFEYYRILISDSDESKHEFSALSCLLIAGESYFFRDAGQFDLLRKTVLPELISSHNEDRRLRIWSAGCSTGEEPYSLAILVNELIPDLCRWEVFILGTDIKSELLEKAEKGIYGAWSFRQVEPATQSKYFSKRRDEWVLSGRIRRMVAFRQGDLLNDELPDFGKGLHDMDLILCRNMFIYYQVDAISAMVRKLTAALVEGGYLMIGHAETDTRVNTGLKPKVFPGSVIYQKNSMPKAGARKLKAEIGTKPGVAGKHLPRRAVASPVHSKEETATGLSAPGPLNPDSGIKTARAMADRGAYDEAARHCKEAMQADPFNAAPYYLLAQIASDKGDREEEKEMLKKVIYLSPSDAAAYLELSVLYEDEGGLARARKMRASALKILKGMPGDARMEPYADLTIEELIEHLEKMAET